MRSNELKKLAWNQLRKNYWMVFVTTLIVIAVSSTSVALVGLIITGPLMVGFSIYLMDNIKDSRKADKIETLIEGFKQNLGSAIIAHILRMVFIFLWSLLFIIPGIIKAIAFSMTPYIIADNPDLTATEALDKSQEMMRGHKWRFFCLMFSFIGWYILTLFTFGVGIFFLLPYLHTTIANFYVDLRGPIKESIDLEFE